MIRRLTTRLRGKFAMMTNCHAEGATVVEYAVVLSLIVVAILASVSLLGHEVTHLFKTVAKAIR